VRLYLERIDVSLVASPMAKFLSWAHVSFFGGLPDPSWNDSCDLEYAKTPVLS
jgi:hypothetical protein